MGCAARTKLESGAWWRNGTEWRYTEAMTSSVERRAARYSVAPQSRSRGAADWGPEAGIEGLTGLRAFVRVAEAGGFAAAARRHGLTPSALAKAVGRLEAGLGAPLLHRTTRSVRLTDEGRLLLERARRILDEVAEAEAALAGTRAEPAGHLRISLPVAMGEFLLAGALPRFLAAHPKITLEVLLDDRMVRVAEEGFDAVVRITAGPLSDSALLATTLGPHRVGAYAAPAYLGRAGTPATPAELSAHECIGFVPPGAAAPLHWTFGSGREVVRVAPRGRLMLNSNNAMLAAAVAGHGIVALPDYVAARAVEEERLAPVLADATASLGEVHVLRPSSRTALPKVRALVALLREQVRQGGAR